MVPVAVPLIVLLQRGQENLPVESRAWPLVGFGSATHATKVAHAISGTLPHAEIGGTATAVPTPVPSSTEMTGPPRPTRGLVPQVVRPVKGHQEPQQRPPALRGRRHPKGKDTGNGQISKGKIMAADPTITAKAARGAKAATDLTTAIGVLMPKPKHDQPMPKHEQNPKVGPDQGVAPPSLLPCELAAIAESASQACQSTTTTQMILYIHLHRHDRGIHDHDRIPQIHDREVR